MIEKSDDIIKMEQAKIKKSEKKQSKAYEIDSHLVLKVNNLCKTYITGKISIQALQDINLEIRKGELVAIVGPSGSGKTTLINCLGALDFPDSGQIIYNVSNNGEGHNITEMSNREQKYMRLNNIGLIFQFYNLFPVLTAYENVELPALIAKKNPTLRKKKVKDLLKIVGLGERIKHYPTQLSGGEQQRVTIARSLINDPLLLLADEPTGELDTETTIQIMKIFLHLKDSGHSILMVTHNNRIAQAADRILTLTDGKIVSEKKAGKNIDDVYNIEFGGH